MSKLISSLFFLATFLGFFNSESHACGYWEGDPAGTWHGYNYYGCPYMRNPVQKQDQGIPGETVFESKECTACHTIGQGDKVGPDLMGLFKRRDEKWVRNFISNPSNMIKSDKNAKKLNAQYSIEMPNPQLTDEEINQLINFLKEATK